MKNSLHIPPVPPPTPADLKAIDEACRDYASGWFTADAERMQRALHPDLVKRTIWFDLQDNTVKVSKTANAGLWLVTLAQEAVACCRILKKHMKWSSLTSSET